MNEYHLIVSYDHFRWKSSGGSIIRCVSKLRVVDRPLLTYGKLANEILLNLKKSTKIIKYPVVIHRAINSNFMRAFSFRVKLNFNGQDWHEHAEIHRKGKVMITRSNKRKVHHLFNPERIKALKSAANSGLVTVQVAAFK